jgi:hypothetical protein
MKSGEEFGNVGQNEKLRDVEQSEKFSTREKIFIFNGLVFICFIFAKSFKEVLSWLSF